MGNRLPFPWRKVGIFCNVRQRDTRFQRILHSIHPVFVHVHAGGYLLSVYCLYFFTDLGNLLGILNDFLPVTILDLYNHGIRKIFCFIFQYFCLMGTSNNKNYSV